MHLIDGHAGCHRRRGGAPGACMRADPREKPPLSSLLMKNYLDLTGRIALVTGASSGIGAATAAVLADLGARVAIGYHANQKGAHEVCDGIVKAGGKAVALQADMRNPAEVRPLVERATREIGPLDILVNNAGSLVKRV